MIITATKIILIIVILIMMIIIIIIIIINRISYLFAHILHRLSAQMLRGCEKYRLNLLKE